MAVTVRQSDATLAAALARGLEVAAAAAQAGVSERTAFRRLQEPDFRAMVAEARSQLVRRVGGRLADAGDKAVATLAALLDGEDDKVKLGAAKAIIDSMFKSAELVELQAQVEELRLQVEGVNRARDAHRGQQAG